LSDERVDALYALPLERFTAERDALAKEIRREGDAGAAARVKSLRKPTVAAWAVNQIVRREPEAASALLDAGSALASAHAELASGGGSAERLRKASAREEEAVMRLVEHARRLKAERSKSLGEATLERVTETLHAASLDEEVRELVASGRLDRERRAVGIGALAPDTRAPGVERSKAKKTRAEKKGAAPQRVRPDRARERRVAAVREQLAQAEGEQAERLAALWEATRAHEAATKELRRTEREQRAAARAVASSERKVERLRRKLAAAED
jgi:hypothetical protein